MSLDIAISVENLSKSYLVGHNCTKNERYTSLRDVLARNAHDFVRKTRDMISGRQIVQGDEVEEFWALKDVSFEIKRGDSVGIIGSNGAGKSTLLKILSRITEPTKGRVEIHGRVASLLEVGTGFHPELTGRENIFLNGAILGMSRREIQCKFDEIVDFAAVEKFLDTPVKRYSSGMYVRLAFAVAAHLEPEILIVDEVLAVGDAQFQKKCLGKMEDIGKSGRTVLFVSHNMTAVQNLCSSVIYFSEGTVNGIGDSTEQINYYLKSANNNLRVNERTIGKNLLIDDFCLLKDSYRSMDEIDISLKLEALEPEIIKDLAILIYSESGERVSIIDLRSANNPYIINSGECAEFKVNIESIPLVEGSYRIGLYISSNSFNGNLMDLILLNISSKDWQFSPYRSSVRGVLELETSFEYKILKRQNDVFDNEKK